MAASHDQEAFEVYNGVSTRDVPNAAWGLSSIGHKNVQIAGWVSVVFLLLLNFGNHEGHVETIWLVGLAVVFALGLVLFAFAPRFNQVRTVTAKNQPQGYVEPDHVYNQRTLSGNYAELSDSQLRSLNIEPSRVQHLRTQAKA